MPTVDRISRDVLGPKSATADGARNPNNKLSMCILKHVWTKVVNSAICSSRSAVRISTMKLISRTIIHKLWLYQMLPTYGTKR